MEKANKVSVWLGNLDSERDFNNYMEEQFDEEGDMTSVFMSDCCFTLFCNISLFLGDFLADSPCFKSQFKYSSGFISGE